MKLKPVFDLDAHASKTSRRKRGRKRLRTIAMLPALLTLGNLFCGFLAIYYCGREMHDLGGQIAAGASLTMKSVRWEAIAPTYLSVGVLMLIVAMLCDALDGRVARMTDQASKFGEQLDSLADAVSFGAAPALMMVTLLQREMALWSSVPLGADRFRQGVVLIGGVYACCAVLRLARFNVETSLEETAHQGFRGLPSPGAAAAVISLIWFHEHLVSLGNWAGLANALTYAALPCTLAVGLLMVSRVPYVHAVSSLLSRRPFGHVVLVVLAVPLVFLYTHQAAFFLAWAFVLSGPISVAWRHLKRQSAPSKAGHRHEQEDTPSLNRQAQ